MNERTFIQLKPGAERPKTGAYNQPAVYVPKNQNIQNPPNLSFLFGPIEDQGNLGSCSAVSSTEWYSAWRVKNGLPWVEYSELAQYWEERNYEGTVNTDSGAFIHDAVRALEEFGVMSESDDSYNTASFANKPDETKFIKDSQLPSNIVKQIDPNNILHDALDALDNGYALLFGFIVFSALTSPEVAQTGILTMPNQDEMSNAGHAVKGVYNDKANQRILCRNQWGKEWGISKDGTKSTIENGYFWMPYDYFSKFVWECYIIEDGTLPQPQPSPTPQPQPASNEIVIEIYIGKNQAFVNSHEVILPTVPIIQDNISLIPDRFIAEAFGATVDWNQDLQKITITKQTP